MAETLSSGVKRSALEADHSPQSSPDVKNGFTHTSISPYAFMACRPTTLIFFTFHNFQADTCRDDFRSDFYTHYNLLFSHVLVKHPSHRQVLSLCVHLDSFNLRTRWTCMVGITLWPLCPRGKVPDTHRIGGWVGLRDDLHLLNKEGTHFSAGNRITNRPLSSKVFPTSLRLNLSR
jgi:hypothetical protein